MAKIILDSLVEEEDARDLLDLTYCGREPALNEFAEIMDSMAQAPSNSPGVHGIDPLQDLVGYLQDGLERETTATLGEEVLQGSPQEIHDHRVVTVVRPEVVDLCET